MSIDVFFATFGEELVLKITIPNVWD